VFSYAAVGYCGFQVGLQHRLLIILYYQCTLPPMALSYLLLALVALGPLRLPPTNSRFPDGTDHPFAAVYMDGARARAALANRPMTIQGL